MSVTILAIESSCDDTSIAIIQDAKLLSLGVSGQKIHEKYGGVVPELASRAHLQEIIPLLDSVLKEAKINKNDIDAVAFTVGPGLLGSLLVGVTFAKSFALANQIPLIEVNHMEGHILAHMIDDPKPDFPFLCLTVSGGHTEIVKVNAPNDMTILGKTLDDAAGEAFDKTGKMLSLPYPAGPVIDKLAKEGKPVYSFSKPSLKGYEFSFSGLKTGIRNFLSNNTKKNPSFVEENLNDICCSVQNTIVEILLDTLKRAAEDTGIHRLAIAGGVSANSHLRQQFEQLIESKGWKGYIPAFRYCTDNAAMIAITAHYKFMNKEFSHQGVKPQPRLKIH